MPELNLKLDEAVTLADGLSIRVTEITEKRGEQTHCPTTRLGLRLRLGAAGEQLTLFSDEPVLYWHGYRIEYLGAGRSAARLRVDRESDANGCGERSLSRSR